MRPFYCMQFFVCNYHKCRHQPTNGNNQCLFSMNRFQIPTPSWFTCNLSSSASSSWGRQVWSPRWKSESLWTEMILKDTLLNSWTCFGKYMDNLKEIILKSTFDGRETLIKENHPWYSLITLPWSVNAAVPTFGSDLRTLFWQTINVWWTMMNYDEFKIDFWWTPNFWSTNVSVPQFRDSLRFIDKPLYDCLFQGPGLKSPSLHSVGFH